MISLAETKYEQLQYRKIKKYLFHGFESLSIQTIKLGKTSPFDRVTRPIRNFNKQFDEKLNLG